MDRNVMILFCFLESLVVLQAVTVLTIALKAYNDGGNNNPIYVPFNIFQNSLNIAISVAVFGLLTDAFLRISRLIEHNTLALSKLQMFYHIGAFSLSAVTNSLLWGSAIWLVVSPTTIDNLSWRTNYLLYVGEVYEFGVFFSTSPVFFILNSLIDKGIAEKEQEAIQIIDENASVRTSI